MMTFGHMGQDPIVFGFEVSYMGCEMSIDYRYKSIMAPVCPPLPPKYIRGQFEL